MVRCFAAVNEKVASARTNNHRSRELTPELADCFALATFSIHRCEQRTIPPLDRFPPQFSEAIKMTMFFEKFTKALNTIKSECLGTGVWPAACV